MRLILIETVSLVRPPEAPDNNRSHWRSAFKAEPGTSMVHNNLGVFVGPTNAPKAVLVPWANVRFALFENDEAS